MSPKDTVRGFLALTVSFSFACTQGTIEPSGATSDDATTKLDASSEKSEAGSDTAVVSPDVAIDTPLDAPLDAPDPCEKRPCGLDKRCVPSSAGHTCVEPCAGISCSAPEKCYAWSASGTPLATDKYGSAMGKCLDPCADAACTADQACVPEAHGAPLGACVERCDCRNCGNCGADGTFVGMQAFCGNPKGSPATMACTKPCGGGAGCIPWDSSGGICWPLEGCFSL